MKNEREAERMPITKQECADPSGTTMPEESMTKTTDQRDPIDTRPVAIARGLILGKQVPGLRPDRVSQFLAPAPPIDANALADIYPLPDDDDRPEDPEDLQYWEEYNSYTPAERAMDHYVEHIRSGIDQRIKDPLLGNELNMAIRRTMIHLMAIHEPETFGALSELVRRQEEELRYALDGLESQGGAK